MKRIVFTAITCSLLLLGCEKEVDENTLDMPDPLEVVVIESNIDLLEDENGLHRDGPFQVTIRRSKAYFGGDNTLEGLTGAFVTIADDAGQLDTLTAIAPGVYQTNNLEAWEGRTYQFHAELEGKVYEAVSQMPNLTPIDTFEVNFEEEALPIVEGYYINMLYSPTASSSSYFRLSTRKNGDPWLGDPESQFRYFLIDDIFGLSDNLNFTLPYNYAAGDTASIDLASIDARTYAYYNSIDQQLQSGLSPLSPVPGNIQGNLAAEGVIGHFAARVVSRRTVVITE